MCVPAFSVVSGPVSLRHPKSLLPRTSTISGSPASNALRLRHRRPVLHPSRPHRTPAQLSSHPPDQPPPSSSSSGGGGGAADGDDEKALQRELSAKVNELFGGRQNVTIDVDTDIDRVKFSVSRARGGLVGRGASVAEAENDAERGAALTVVTSIVVLSVVAGVMFTFLYYNGAVHDSSSADARRYEMPTYGTSSYIDPYKLLEDERKAADAQ